MFSISECTGVIEIPAAIIGNIFSGWIVRRWKLDFHGQLTMAKVVIVVIIASFFSFFIRCPNADFAGVNVKYENT